MTVRFNTDDVEVHLAGAGAGKSHAAMQEMQESLKTYRPDEIAFVTYTKKGVENGISRALKVNPQLTPDDLMHFKTLHALCFREAHLTGSNIMTGRDIAAFNEAFGFNLSMSEVFGNASEDDRLLQRYDAERSGSRRGVFVDGNFDRMRYDRLVNAYESFKQAHGLVDFHDCLLRYMTDGEPLRGVKICLIDECFAPDTLVRMADGSVRAIKDIRVGDCVMGTSGAVRVLDKHIGVDQMYEVSRADVDSTAGAGPVLFRCNSMHLIEDSMHRWNACSAYFWARDCHGEPMVYVANEEQYCPVEIRRIDEGCYVGITVDSPDHLFLLANGCVVHNCQDLTPLQWEVCMKAFSCAEKVRCYGDDFQCQPAGTKVLTRDGLVPIEECQGKSAVTFSMKDYTYYGKQRVDYPMTVACRHYAGPLIQVTPEDGVMQWFTPEHRMLVRWNNRDTSLRCVYLMRRGNWFRVGQCQLFNKQGATHLTLRMNNEGADAAWILTLCRTQEDALVWEQYFSLKYGIPQVSWKLWHGNLVNELYAKFPRLEINAEKLLDDLYLSLHLPMFNHEKAQAKSGGSCMSLCEACNLIPEVMSVPVYYGESRAKKDMLWKPFKTDIGWHDGDVYSLDVPKYHTYITEGGLTVHNCLYTYNGAAPELLIEMASHYRLVKHETSYRLPRKVYEFAREITDVIQDKVPKDYAPAEDREGFVKDLPDRNVLARLIRDDLRHHGAKGGRWMLLFRTNCFIEDMTKTLQQFMVPYHTSKGFCISARDLAKIERYQRYSSEGYGTPEAREKFMRENKITDFRDGFAASELIPGVERYYYQDLVDTWGLPMLREMSKMDDPFLLLSTVHRVKGGEADYAALFMDCTRLVHENMTLNADEELRVLYVGCTRCREGLYLVPSKSRYSLSRLVDIVREVNDL